MKATKCRATSKATGEQCRRWATKGSSVCTVHGSRSPQAMARALVRRTLAEALEHGVRRSAPEVLLDAMGIADLVMTDAKIKAIEHGDPIPPEVIDAMVSAAGRAAALARVATDGSVDEKLRRLREADVDDLSKIMNLVFEVWPGFPSDRDRDAHGPAFKRLVREAIMHVTVGGPRPEVPTLPARSPYRPALEARRPAARSAAGPASPAAPSDPGSGSGRQRGAQRVGDPVDAEVIDGEVEEAEIRKAIADFEPLALPQFPRCDGCAQPREPGHDDHCGWSQVANRRPGW